MFCVPYTYRRVDWHFKFYLYFWYSKNRFYVVRGIFPATNTVASIPSHILDAVEALVDETIFYVSDIVMYWTIILFLTYKIFRYDFLQSKYDKWWLFVAYCDSFLSSFLLICLTS